MVINQRTEREVRIMEVLRNVRLGIVAIGLMLGLASAAKLGAVDFIRGDANSDGVVSYADSQAILGYIFRNVTIPCLDAADANDSGDVDIADAAAVLTYLVFGAYSFPPPFPEQGADTTPGREGWPSGCVSYGGVSPVEDPQASIEVLDAFAEDGTVYLHVAISNSVPIIGYYGALHIEGDIVSSVGEGLSLISDSYFLLSFEAGRVTFLSGYPSMQHPVIFPPGQSILVGEIPACLVQGTAAGDYEVSIVAGELAHASTNQAIHPTLVGGILHVLADVAVQEECAGSNAPPPPLNAHYELVGGTASPGSPVDLTLKMQADAVIQGFAYSVDFDEEVLEALGTDVIWQRPDGGEFDFAVHELNNENATPGNGGVDEGFLIGAAVIDLRRPIGMPANADNDVLRFRMRVRPETTATTTELRFIDGGQGTGAPVPNMLTANGNTEYTRDSASSFVFISGLIGVIPDIVTFVRGDANGDETIDISDPQRTLNHLFLGLGPPVCYDAADANDDGTLNIADAIFSLAYLFSGGRPLPPPFPEAGTDPTADAMGCLHAGN